MKSEHSNTIQKNKQRGPNSTQKLLHRKGNHKENEKTTHRMGEKISKWCNWQGVDVQNIQKAHAAQYQKNKQPNQKMGRRSK